MSIGWIIILCLISFAIGLMGGFKLCGKEMEKVLKNYSDKSCKK